MDYKMSSVDHNGITNLQDAINMIKFLKISHKAEIANLTKTCQKQTKIIKKLESTRAQELTYLSNQLHKYQLDLHIREEEIAKLIAEKDEVIKILNETVKSLQNEIKGNDEVFVKSLSCSSDSGIIEDKSCDSKTDKLKKESPKKRQSSFTKSINFLRKVDFSPKIHKTDSPALVKKTCSFKARLWKQIDKTSSEDEQSSSDDLSTFFVLSPRKLEDSMNNHFTEEPSESERELLFDRVMTRNSVRKSKNYKYKKISRNKSKHLEQIKYGSEFMNALS